MDGVPLLALGSEPEQMNEQAGSSGGNAEGGSPGSSPERITIQVQSFKSNLKFSLFVAFQPIYLISFNSWWSNYCKYFGQNIFLRNTRSGQCQIFIICRFHPKKKRFLFQLS